MAVLKNLEDLDKILEETEEVDKPKSNLASLSLSSDQEKALASLNDWWQGERRYPKGTVTEETRVLTLGGYAGTGKTTLISYFREMLGEKIDVAFMSFTGKAVAVMKKKLYDAGVIGQGDSISTIHSYMYTPELDPKGNIIGWRFKSMVKKGDWPERDVKGAKKLGMKTCLAKYGWDTGRYIKADYEIKRLHELIWNYLHENKIEIYFTCCKIFYSYKCALLYF